MLKLFTDTDTDITPEIAARYNYSLISMPYSTGSETTYPYEDFETFDCHSFYDSLRNGLMPTTGSISEEKYIGYFEPVFASGDDILYVHFSKAMTGTFDVMNRALMRLKEKYPERKFYEVDTKGISTISYIIVREIGKLYKRGAGIEEILEWASREVDRFAMYFFVDNLAFFKRSGRVSGLSAMMGTLVGIRPIIIMTQEGKMESIGTERGRYKAMNRLLTSVYENGTDLLKYGVVIGHTDAGELAEEIAKELREKYGDSLDIEILPCNPTTGSHCGPDGVGIAFHAVHR